MGDEGESGGVNGVEMSCRMMGHYFWHYSSEPRVFLSPLLEGLKAGRAGGMKLSGFKKKNSPSVNYPLQNRLSSSAEHLQRSHIVHAIKRRLFVHLC